MSEFPRRRLVVVVLGRGVGGGGLFAVFVAPRPLRAHRKDKLHHLNKKGIAATAGGLRLEKTEEKKAAQAFWKVRGREGKRKTLKNTLVCPLSTPFYHPSAAAHCIRPALPPSLCVCVSLFDFPR